MRQLLGLSLALLGLAVSGVAAQDRPSQEAIDQVNRLGRTLYQYDQAAWHGTDAVMAHSNRASEHRGDIRTYVVEPKEGGWRVSLGRLADDGASFLVITEVDLDSLYLVHAIRDLATPEPRTGFSLAATRARSQAMARFKTSSEIVYNSAVLPASDGHLFVYLFPAQPQINLYYVGADVRYTYDPAKDTIVEEQRLHNSLLTFDLRTDPTAMSFASAVVTDIPTETDVFYAMSRPPASDANASHCIVTEDWAFFLKKEGIVGIVSIDVWKRINGEK